MRLMMTERKNTAMPSNWCIRLALWILVPSSWLPESLKMPQWNKANTLPGRSLGARFSFALSLS
jgi:hypothetical protein